MVDTPGTLINFAGRNSGPDVCTTGFDPSPTGSYHLTERSVG
jgi:hypothetical protein